LTLARRVAPALAALLAAALLPALLLVACAAPPSPSPAPTTSPPPSLSPTPLPSTATATPNPDVIPAAWQDGGIFSDSYQKAYDLLRTMTLEEKVGQVLLARCGRDKAPAAARDLHLGGFTLFVVDFKDRTREQVVDTIASYQAAARIPLALAVDEEGGSVVRISANPLLADKPFNSPHYLYLHGGFGAIDADAVKKAALLRALGPNLLLAPISDVSTDSADFLHGRTLGQSAELTAQFVVRVVGWNRQAGLSSTLKHFPGYGDNPDTHYAGAVDPRPLVTFETRDFLPFQAGIDAGVECVMVSHLIVAALDPDRPASLSPAVHAVLRDKLHFTGVIVSDSLGMGAITSYTNDNDPHVQALLAGNDLLCTPLYQQGYDALLAAVGSGTLPLPTLEHAVFRVLAWKISRGIVPA